MERKVFVKAEEQHAGAQRTWGGGEMQPTRTQAHSGFDAEWGGEPLKALSQGGLAARDLGLVYQIPLAGVCTDCSEASVKPEVARKLMLMLIL